jgi:hypothetical protein
MSIRSLSRASNAKAVAAFAVAALISACSGSGSPSAPTVTAAPAAIAISNFQAAASGTGSSRTYRLSLTMTETSGRTAAVVNTIRFGFGAGISANGDPTSPLRIAPGGSASSGTITLTDTGSLTSAATSVTVTVGWSDDSGRPGSVTSATSITEPPPAPVARNFTLAGVITDVSTLRAIRGATVTARDSTNQSRTGTTDGNGYYSLAPLREGAIALSISATGYQATTRTVTLSGDTSYEVLLQPNAVVPPPPPPSQSRTRIGAICNDGWLSDATGSGACSSHGGVRCWRYSDGTCTNP